ncbi:M6 family metalloprotease domain-containing protein [Sulfurimonas sp. HSL3-7]|uniref:M6 family metalloprotease domain-containing protein n=1 Tax=Sulfonitrofixus jiaomeiensis TaxID=3131938 RepID=UPI0031F8DA7A
MFIRQLILLFPLFFIACDSKTGTSDTNPYTGPQVANEIFTPGTTLEERHMLVIRLDYANQHFVNDESSWAAKIFGTQNQQLNHYMSEVSNGQFQYTPVAENDGANDGVVTVYFSSEHPDPDINSVESSLHPSLKEAVITVSNNGFDFSLYDDDQNGNITSDELLIVFIMAGEEDAYSGGSSLNGVWAHQYCTSADYTPNVNGVYVMGCDQDGKYAIFGERHHDTITASHDATIGIIAHELGHAALGLIDLYDVTYNSAGIGYFGLMSSGTWGQADAQEYPGQTPVPFSAWSKIYAGWYRPAIETSTNIALNGTGYSDYNIIKVPISGTEYFLLENRSTTGYDRGLAYPLDGTYMGGITIWHIDEDVISSKFDANTVNDNVSHKGVDLEEANNPVLDVSWYKTGDAKNLYYRGNKTEFSPTTFPNSDSYYSSGTGISIYNISDVGSTMTVDIINPN